MAKIRLIYLLKHPTEFFEGSRHENWKSSFIFFLKITIIISIVTPIVNYIGIESTDFSSSYQAQIIAYRFLKKIFLAQYGIYAYVLEAFLIVGFATLMLLFLAVFIHLVFRLLGGNGSISNAVKALCYGIGPCVLGGFLPYISLFAAFYSMLLQFYIGPKTLYEVKESRAVVFLAIVLALAFIEMFVMGTTVGFLI